jgi:hypothetical protein
LEEADRLQAKLIYGVGLRRGSSDIAARLWYQDEYLVVILMLVVASITLEPDIFKREAKSLGQNA